MRANERIMLLEDAQALMADAISKIRSAVEDTSEERSAGAYIIPHLENWTYGNNPYDDTAIPKLISGIRKERDEEDA